ncbi:M10 family metallopeptidase C-terminal domain-containing protein (plasmid) [Rhodobacteraceae bacterium M382]|nr:M10 family metallopeptidase C-terminal domain-containing protein [Rhodobacteraceae bacterium M382]
MAGTTSVTPRTTNTTLRGLEGDTKWSSTALTYSFASSADSAATTAEFTARSRPAGETINYLDASDTSENAQRTASVEAFTALARVSGLTFSASATFAAADFKVVGVDNFGLAGQSTFPGTNPKGTSTTDFESWNFFNTTSFWTSHGRETGGGDFMVYNTLHEFGHGVALGHPHDTGHGSSAISLNVGSTPSTTDNPLDNERYTVMSYERGGTNSNLGNKFGHAVTPMALDIAVLQSLYGANSSTHTGNTTYNLTDRGTTAYDGDGSDGSVSIGRAFYSIWDAGGSGDSIDYGGGQRAVINLNAATLDPTGNADLNELIKGVKKSQVYSDLPTDFKYDYQGDANHDASAYYAGGFFSRVFTNSTTGDLGGYSIANGVVIENASGGAKGDLLIGNTANNTLDGKGGKDALFGFDGNDTLKGGADDDEMTGGDGDDRLEGGAGTDVAIFSEACRNYEITRDDATGQVTIRHKDGGADGTDILIDVETARFSDGEIDLTAEEIDDCPPLDFTFLVDLSGSFGDDLPNFVASAKQIAADLRADNPDVKFAIASFIDHPVSPFGSSGDYLYKAELSLTDDVAAFETTLDGLRVRSGGDFPEAQWVGLWRAANGVGLNLRDGSSRIIYMATDAPAHDASDYGLDESTITDFLETEGIATEGAPGDEEPFEAPDGYDGEGTAPELPSSEDLLIAAVGEAFSGLSAIPIIGTSGSEEHYREALGGLGSDGVVVTTSRDSSDVADAVRAGLAEIGGDITESGTAGNDELTGTADPDVLLGLGGNDTIRGLGGDDELDGGSGNDLIEGGDGNDRIDGGSGDDTLDGGAGNDRLNPGSGSDLLLIGDGDDVIEGPGNSLNGDRVGPGFGPGDMVILRTETLFGDPFMDFTPGPDASTPGTSGVLLDLDGDGTNEFSLFFEGNVIDGLKVGGLGNDLVIGYLGSEGTAGNDTLTGTEFPDEINALGGDDRLIGLNGDDTLIGGPGDDTFLPGLGNDLIRPGDGTSLIEGSAAELNGDRIGDGFGNEDAIFLRGANFTGEPELLFTPDAGGTGPGSTAVMLDLDGDGTKEFSLLFDGDLTGTGLGVVDEGSDIGIGGITFDGTANDDDLTGNQLSNQLNGFAGNDRLIGLGGDDRISGGDGNDTLNGGDGNDVIRGGATDADLRDVIFGGDGNDDIDGGHGNDGIFGGAGNDIMAGGFGVDELEGQAGNDVITGSAFSDLVFGGAGNDFVNGGFGHDRINGGTGADKFFHAGVEGHGSDWVQDYVGADGDVLLWGGGPATASDFQVNFAHTATPAGERSGDDAVMEAFVIYKPTEQIMWALVDGQGQSSINLQIGGETFDLLV